MTMWKILIGVGSTLIAGWVCLLVTSKPSRLVPTSRNFIEAGTGDTVCRADDKPWAAAGATTVVLVSTSTCQVCLANRSFEEILYEACRLRGIPVVYVLPEVAASDDRAKELNTMGRTVLRVNLLEFGISRVPTALRVDSRGIVQSVWTGTVPLDSRGEVLDSIVSGPSLQAYQRVSPSEAATYAAHDYQVLALTGIRGPIPIPGERMIIPANEVAARAKYELDPNRGVLVDCASARNPKSCQEAAVTLLKEHFKRVLAVGLPARPNHCGT
jgi:hypothetical protein